jgi:nondiscriminating glutamyl-tRNA synthetase
MVERSLLKKTRVRFAPSPTGHLHVGGARTALFNFLFARHTGGEFIIRIEDTDRERSTGEFEERLLEDLSWLGLEWDEGPGKGGDLGPYRQTERTDIYREYALRLVDGGKAFPCFCTDEELDTKREKMKKSGAPPQYDGTCRGLTTEERVGRRDRGLPESIRFSVEGEGDRTIADMARGDVSFPSGMVGDFVILRSNGMPTYNFAAALDDSLMKITHVIRGAEHLANTLRQVMIYDALGLEQPLFAHIPLILGEDRAKLSKRHGAPNVRDYREKGYPAGAIINYLAFLGWSTKGESEILSMDDLIGEFELGRVSDSPSIFDEAKLNWVSASHVRAGGSGKYLDDATPFFPGAIRERYGSEALGKIFDILSDNLPSFSMIEHEIDPFMPVPLSFDEDAAAALVDCGELMKIFARSFAQLGAWDIDGIKQVIKDSGKEAGVKGKGLYMPLRAAVTGRGHGPDLTAILLIKGRDDVIKALEAAG